MADDNDQSADNPPKAKRRLRTGSETVRERSIKFQQLSDQPAKAAPVRIFFGGFFWPLRQLGRSISRLGRFRVVRFIGRIVFPSYFRGAYRELRMVTWPTRRQSWKLTYAVIVFSLLFGVIIAIVDFGLDKLFKEFIVK